MTGNVTIARILPLKLAAILLVAATLTGQEPKPTIEQQLAAKEAQIALLKQRLADAEARAETMSWYFNGCVGKEITQLAREKQQAK